MAVDAGLPIALSSDAHVPEQLGFRYDDALAALADAGVDRAVRVRAARAADGADRVMVRTGLGIDTHAFAPGRPLILGGVDIPHEQGLAGHSDADVLTHAVIDALLGAAALGDIGQHFPDTDPRFEGADSLELLRDGRRLPRRARLRDRQRRRDRDRSSGRSSPPTATRCATGSRARSGCRPTPST